MGISYAMAVLQVLHYLPKSMQEKVAYLRDIGMGQEQVTQTILRLPQLLSLDVHRNLQPKYSYLKHQLGGTVKTLCKYPAYFSLSLPGRCGFLHLTLLFTNTMHGSAVPPPVDSAVHADTCCGRVALSQRRKQPVSLQTAFMGTTRQCGLLQDHPSAQILADGQGTASESLPNELPQDV